MINYPDVNESFDDSLSFSYLLCHKLTIIVFFAFTPLSQLKIHFLSNSIFLNIPTADGLKIKELLVYDRLI